MSDTITIRWIPVGESLPEYDCDVLVHDGQHTAVGRRKRTAYFPTDRNGFFYIGIYGRDITHWMPMPTPPEQKES